MKTELRLAAHSVLPGAAIAEIWYDGEFIGEVVGADGPGVRILTKHTALATAPDRAAGVMSLGVAIVLAKGKR